MPIFNRKRVKPHLTRALYRALDNPHVNNADKERIQKVLDSSETFNRLADRVGTLAKQHGAPEPTPPTPSAHPFLDFLIQHLPEILALILQLLGG